MARFVAVVSRVSRLAAGREGAADAELDNTGDMRKLDRLVAGRIQYKNTVAWWLERVPTRDLSIIYLQKAIGSVTITVTPTQTIVCMKWGVRYPSVYVNNLWSMIRRNTARPTRLVCYTDEATGIDPDVTVLPMPSLTLPGKFTNLPWRKISLGQGRPRHIRRRPVSRSRHRHNWIARRVF